MPYQGTYWTQPFSVTDADDAVVDITGWEFKAELRVRLDDAAPSLTLESGTGGFSMIDAANGRFGMNIDAEQSAGLAPGKYQFDVIRTDCTPGPLWMFGGYLFVKEPVTR